MTSLVDLVPHPEPKRDGFGRYLIPDPTTGKNKAWTRATTWASTVAETYGLTKWQLRKCVEGIAHRPDLVARAASIIDPETNEAKRLLDELADQAKEQAGSSARATLGSALHSFCEAADLGLERPVPAPWAADVAAYRFAMNAAGITIDVNHVERIVVVPTLGVAGTFDRLVTLPDGRRVVADLKTGRDLNYSWGEIAIQCALYAHGASMWDPATETHLPMPAVDLNDALIMHLPVETGTCELYLVDIAAGWEMAQLCGTVRTWRKRKNLATPLGTYVNVAPNEPVDDPFKGLPGIDEQPPKPDRTQWMRDRIIATKVNEDAPPAVAADWPANVPPRPPWTDQHINRLHTHLTDIETRFDLPWFQPDPAADLTTTTPLYRKGK